MNRCGFLGYRPAERMKNLYWYAKEKLEALYEQIREESRHTLLNGGCPDDFLLHPEDDTRMSVTLLFRIPAEISRRIEEMLRQLASYCPGLYVYPPSDMHVTVLDILRGRPGLQKPEHAEADGYIECIRSALNGSPPFRVLFRGVTVSDSALLVCGYYEEPLARIRHVIRSGLRKAGLLLEERYETYSCHITVARFPVRITDPQAFLALTERYREANFGSCVIRELEYTYHNWYDSRKETLSRFCLPS